MRTSKHYRPYKLTEAVKARLENTGFVLVCSKCGNPIQVGEKVKKSCMGNRFYHEDCWKSLFFEEERVKVQIKIQALPRRML